jgi:hypothetical protein
MDVTASIQILHPDAFRTRERGYVTQYDIQGPTFVIECKRHKALGWNELKKYYEKLVKVTPNGMASYLVFQSNRQPPLVMYGLAEKGEGLVVMEFEQFFQTGFIKHTPTRKGIKL